MAASMLAAALLVGAHSNTSNTTAVLASNAGTGAPGCPACMTNASTSTLDVPLRICEPGNALSSRVILRARASDGSATGAGGDVITAWLDDRGSDPEPIAAGGADWVHTPAFQWALEVRDRCNGEYVIELPCADLRHEQLRRAASPLDPPRFRLSVYLNHALKRHARPAREWWCPERASNFTGWDNVSAGELHHFLYKCQPRALPAAGTPVALHLDKVRRPAPKPRHARSTCAVPRTLKRADQQPALLEPWLWPCAGEGRRSSDQVLATNLMRFGGHFAHCVHPAGLPECPPFRYATEPPACLAGQRITLMGDSVTDGTFADLAHLWARWNTLPDGRRVSRDMRDDARLCHYDGKKHVQFTPTYRMPKALLVNLSSPSGQQLEPVRFERLDAMNPMFVGLGAFLVYHIHKLDAALRSSDVVIIESIRHDMSANKPWRMGRPAIGEYRQKLKLLVEHLTAARDTLRRDLGRAPRVLWRTAMAPPDLPGCDCQYPGNLEPYTTLLNTIATEAFLAAGMEVLPGHTLRRASSRWGWWPIVRNADDGRVQRHRSIDVHTHEGFCPKFVGEDPARVEGWISKVNTQLQFAALCAEAA